MSLAESLAATWLRLKSTYQSTWSPPSDPELQLNCSLLQCGCVCCTAVLQSAVQTRHRLQLAEDHMPRLCSKSRCSLGRGQTAVGGGRRADSGWTASSLPPLNLSQPTFRSWTSYAIPLPVRQLVYTVRYSLSFNCDWPSFCHLCPIIANNGRHRALA